MPSIALPVSLRGQLLSGVRFSPVSLFAANEPGVWYDPSDLTTLFQDTAGTTPVTTPGQTVALALDKSRGLVLGSELVTNGTFDSGITGWSPANNATLAWSSGQISITKGASSFPNAVQTIAGLTTGRSYLITATFSNPLGLAVYMTLNSSGTYPSSTATSGTLRVLQVAGSNQIAVGIDGASGTVGQSVTFDNISVRELPGNHATQATAASRPTYGIVPRTGRRNLLERTEEFDNAYWTKGNSTVTANAAVAPNGTTTADALNWAASVNPQLTNAAIAVSAGTPLTLTAYGKAGTKSSLTLIFFNDGSNFAVASFNLTNGTAGAPSVTGSRFTSVSASAVDVGNGWYRCTLSANTNTLTSVATWLRADTAVGSGDNIFIWGAQLETGSTATAYQRVGSQFDVTEAGVPSLSYLFFDGIDDFLVTPTITPGVDKVQVFAGVRKLSDAATGVVVEHSVNWTTNSGAFSLLTSSDTTATLGPFYRMTSGWAGVPATASVQALASGYAAPITNVIFGAGDIAGDLTSIRVNQVAGTSGTGDQGTGNYLAHPLYIGRRGGTSLPFNGNIFSLIVRFGANLDANTITNTETWVNGKTGAY